MEIKQAIEKLLGSKVANVRTAMKHGKMKRQGKFVGKRPDWKKAYVGLRDGGRCRSSWKERSSTMPVRKYKPTSPGRCFQSVQVFDEITTQEFYKLLTEFLLQEGRAQQSR